MIVRKVSNILLWVLITLAAIGGIGKIIDWFRDPEPIYVIQKISEPRGEISLAIRFAEEWLTIYPGEGAEERKKRLQPYIQGIKLLGWTPPTVGQEPKDLFVTNVESYSDAFHMISIEAECILTTGETRTLALDVSVMTLQNGQLAIYGEPMFKHPKQHTYRPRPSTPEADQVIYATATPVITDFVRSFLSSTDQNDLANLLAVGSDIVPLGPIMEFDGVQDHKIFVLEGGAFEAQVLARVRDPVTNAVFYQLLIVDFIRDDNGKYYVTKVWTS